MIYSFFIDNTSCHIFTTNTLVIYKISTLNKLADKIPMYIRDTLPSCSITKVIYPLGPSSFTTTRIINSIIKGMKIVNPNIEFIGISTFLTYISIINKISGYNVSGLIALPTFRGDYFTVNFNNKVLSDISINTIDYVKSNDGILDTEFKDYNIALQQFKVLHSKEIVSINKNFISYGTDISYNITPIFRKINESL